MREVPPASVPSPRRTYENPAICRRFAPLLALMIGVLPGCFGNQTDAFPADLAPLEMNAAEAPQPKDGDMYPEKISLFDVAGPDFHIVHGRGYVKAPMADVYDALRTPEAAADRRKVDTWEVVTDPVEAEECADLPAGIKHCFRIDNVVEDLITVKFHVTWRFGDVKDEDGEVVGHLGRWQKTWGSEVIELLEGSVEIKAVEEGVTEVALIEHLDAFAGSRDNAISFVKDYYANILALSHNEPVPSF